MTNLSIPNGVVVSQLPDRQFRQFQERLPLLCKHALVAPGQLCPECLWYFAAHDRLTTAERQEMLSIYRQACEIAVPANLLPAIRSELSEGLWYGLRFVRRLKRGRAR